MSTPRMTLIATSGVGHENTAGDGVATAGAEDHSQNTSGAAAMTAIPGLARMWGQIREYRLK